MGQLEKTYQNDRLKPNYINNYKSMREFPQPDKGHLKKNLQLLSYLVVKA